MTAETARPPAGTAGEILHGGAQRLGVRWVNRARPDMTLSRYAVAPGTAVSLHVHTGKTEYWLITAGTGVATVGETTIPVVEGDVVATEPLVPHALLNTGTQPLLFVNVVVPTGDGPVTTTELA
ncbi:MAG: cupin domain-containing protein [Burkholderiales bacterium]|jgi:mannose-6-phosphate isomerase-like protein (cupin superfamily)|nr:cupin domain-containing protein [Burkholderiales bacterium]